MKKRALRILIEAPDQGPQETRLGTDGRLALSAAPRVEFVEVGEIETFERDPAVTRGRFLQLLERAAFDFPVGQGGQCDDVDLDPCRVKADAHPVSDDALLGGVVHEAPQL